MKKNLLLIILFSFLGVEAAAQVRISEIMYDLEGTDTKREWIEVENIGSTDIALHSWKLFENDTNHKITHISGLGMLPPGSFGIIAVDTTTFLVDWPSFVGPLFDSSFSLKNTGESLEIRDENLTSVDQVAYIPDWGAAGDGNSLQKVNNSWSSRFPTPGIVNSTTAVENEETSNEENSNENEVSKEVSNQSGSSGSVAAIEPQIFARGGEDRVVIVGADTEFRGEAIGFKGVPMQADRYVWNFGDGFTKEGKAIFHVYHYPGKYVATLSVAAGKYSASDKLIVDAREALVTIGYAGNDRIELLNKEDFELDLSWWILQSEKTSFILPRNTTILPRSTLILAGEATELSVSNSRGVQLLYPNGKLVSRLEEIIAPERTIFTAVVTTPPPPVKEQNTFEKEPNPTPDEELLPEEEIVSDKEQIASSLATVGDLPARNANLYKWLLMLVSLLSVAAIAALIMRKNKRYDEIEIID